MIKDHHIVLDRAVNRLQIRLDELKVRRSGRPRVGRIPHRDIETSQRFHRYLEGRGTRDTLLAFHCV